MTQPWIDPYTIKAGTPLSYEGMDKQRILEISNKLRRRDLHVKDGVVTLITNKDQISYADWFVATGRRLSALDKQTVDDHRTLRAAWTLGHDPKEYAAGRDMDSVYERLANPLAGVRNGF